MLSAICYITILLLGESTGDDSDTEGTTEQPINETVVLDNIHVDHGPKLDALKALYQQMMSDYGGEEPFKENPDHEHFVFNVTFFADAGHFDMDPDSLEKELKEILKNIDHWTNSLKEPHFSVKFDWKLKVFKPKDKDRIAYNYRVQVLNSENIFDAMRSNKLAQEDMAHILFVLIPYLPENEQIVYSGKDPIRGVAGPGDFREGGLGVGKIFTSKHIIYDFLRATPSGYQWRDQRRVCLARNTCYMKNGSQRDNSGPNYDLEMDAMKAAEKLHILDNPTPELITKLVESNKTIHHQFFMGVIAHEIGHLLGAPERGIIESVDDQEKDWDVMYNPVPGTRYGDTSRYAIYMKTACKLYLTHVAFTRKQDIKSRKCNPRLSSNEYLRVPGPAYYSDKTVSMTTTNNENNKWPGNFNRPQITWIRWDPSKGGPPPPPDHLLKQPELCDPAKHTKRFVTVPMTQPVQHSDYSADSHEAARKSGKKGGLFLIEVEDRAKGVGKKIAQGKVKRGSKLGLKTRKNDRKMAGKGAGGKTHKKVRKVLLETKDHDFSS